MEGDKQGRLKKLYVPLVVLLGVGIALSWYGFGWVASQREYFRKRDFRQLATLSDQIQRKADNFDHVMDHILNRFKESREEGAPLTTNQEKSNYLKIICPDLEYLPELPQGVGYMKLSDPPSLDVARDEGKYYMFLALCADPRKCAKNPDERLYARSDVEKLIAPFTTSMRNAFAVILVARQRNGDIIFQTRWEPGIHVTNVSGLQTTRGAAAIDLQTLGEAARRTEVLLAGASYTLYSQPLRLSYPSMGSTASLAGSEDKKGESDKNNTKDKKAAGNTKPSELEEWIVCGLVRSDRLIKDSMAIPSTFVLVFGLALLFICFFSPFIKLELLRAKERLSAHDGVFLSLSAFLCAALLTFAALDLYYYGLRFDDEADRQLKEFAGQMQSHFKKEEDRIWRQLDAFDTVQSDPEFSKELAEIKSHTGDNRKDCDFPLACSPLAIDGEPIKVPHNSLFDLLSARTLQRLLTYPYLNFVVWDDYEGNQRIKWSYQHQITPFLYLPDENIPYYESLREEFDWLAKEYDKEEADQPCQPSPGGSVPGPRPGGIGPTYSPNSGANLVSFWRVENPCDHLELPRRLNGSEGSPNKLLSATLVTRPISLIGPVLPGDFQFAVVDQDGEVKFHSDQTKNLIENFFEECDQDEALRSLVRSHAAGFLRANYQGRRHHLYVCPLEHATGGVTCLKGVSQWSLVVFEDARSRETMNVEALSTASILFLLYALGYALIWALGWLLMHAFRNAEYPRKWFWPDDKKEAAYRVVVILNALILLLFLPWIFRASPAGALLAGFLIPALALSLTFLAVRSAGEEGATGPIAVAWRRLEDLVSHVPYPAWQIAHTSARMSLLIVVAVLPCVAFFRAAFEFEEMLLISRGQSKLVRSIQERRERVRREYQGVELGHHRDEILPAPKDNGLASYHAAFYCTGLDNSQRPENDPTPDWFGKPVTWLLTRVRPAYNEIANETKALIADESGVADRKCSVEAGGNSDQLALNCWTQVSGDALSVKSTWERFPVGWGDWRWWVCLAVFLAALLYLGWEAKKVFLLDLYHPLRPGSASLGEPADAANLLVVGLPLSGKTEALMQRVERGDIYPLDLAEIAKSKNWAETYSYEALGKAGGLTVAVDHLEYSGPEEDPGGEQKLQFLERLVHEPDRRVMLISNIDPLLNFCAEDGGRSKKQASSRKAGRDGSNRTVRPAGGPAKLKQRWAALLSSFVRRDFQAQDAAQDDAFSDTLAKLSSEDEGIRDFFRHECGPTPYLRKIGAEIVNCHDLQRRMSRETIVAEVGEQARAYYSMLWATLSNDEKLILAQVAREGLINPKSSALAAQLMRKGLIVRDPHFRLINRSFARFVISALPAQIMEQWEKGEIGVPWSTLRLLLLTAAACLGLFLYVTQQSLFQSVATYIAALAAAVPVLIKVVGMFRGGPAEAAGK